MFKCFFTFKALFSIGMVWHGIWKTKKTVFEKNSIEFGSTCITIIKKRLKWSDECMLKAMDVVKQGSSVKRPAEQHGVQRTML